jgi:hypothetical protein
MRRGVENEGRGLGGEGAGEGREGEGGLERGDVMQLRNIIPGLSLLEDFLSLSLSLSLPLERGDVVQLRSIIPGDARSGPTLKGGSEGEGERERERRGESLHAGPGYARSRPTLNIQDCRSDPP